MSGVAKEKGLAINIRRLPIIQIKMEDWYIKQIMTRRRSFKSTKEIRAKSVRDIWTRWAINLLKFSVPLFFGTFFTQLSFGSEVKPALMVSTLTLYGAIADFISKSNEVENL